MQKFIDKINESKLHKEDLIGGSSVQFVLGIVTLILAIVSLSGLATIPWYLVLAPMFLFTIVATFFVFILTAITTVFATLNSFVTYLKIGGK